MNGVMKKMKWFIISALIVLLVGMTLFGVFGMNNTVDYSSSYEVEVRVDQGFTEANDVLKTSADKYFADNGVGVVSYQIVDEGSAIIYKFSEDVTEKVSGLKLAVDTALDGNDKTKDVSTTVKVNQVVGNKPLQVGSVLLACGIGLVVMFICALFIGKLASALSVVCSYVGAALIFIALMGITRIHTLPHVEYSVIFASVLSAVLSMITVAKYRQAIKNATTKVSALSIAEKVTASQSKVYLFTLISVLVASVALIALFVPYMMIAGLQLALAGISAVSVAYFITPLIWTAIKKGNVK